nr:O-methyltransferase [uncultured bacterium]
MTTEWTPGTGNPAQRLVALTRGYMSSQIVGAAARLRVAEHLADGPVTSAELASKISADPGATSRFLRAAASIGLVEHLGGDRFAESAMTPLLRSGRRSLVSFVLSFTGPGLYRPLEQLHNVVLEGHEHTERTLGKGLWDYYKENDEESTWFADTMGEQSEFAADILIPRVNFTDTKRIVDVGGSHGVLLSRVLEAHPHTSGVLFDLPEVVERAKDYIAERGLTDRVEFVPGSFLEELPAGGDLYLLKSILCDWDDDSCVRVLSNFRAAAAPGTPLVVSDWLLPEKPDLFLDITNIGLLAYTNGQVRNESQYRELFRRADVDLERITTAEDNWLQVTLFEGRRPE